MPYPAIAVANYFLDLARGEHKSISPMKMQKLVYFAHGWNLAKSGRALIKETVQAWPYGPVIPILYHEFKKYGSRAITEHAGAPDEPDLLDYSDTEDQAHDTLDLISGVWTTYGKMSGLDLSALTHEIGTPWARVISENPGRTGKEIPDEYIQDYFLGLVPDNEPAAVEAHC